MWPLGSVSAMRALWIVPLLVAAALAGCLDDAETDDAVVETPPVAEILDPVAYNATQFGSHPAFGFPTFTDYAGFTGTELPDAWVPPAAAEVPEVLTGLEHLAQVEGVSAGAGIATFGHYAIVSGNGPGAIVDIADPTAPVKVADLDISIRDADVLAFPDGRLVAVLASNGPIHVFDITDPTAPIQLPSLEVGSHNAAVVPGTPIVYNANSRGGADNGLFSPDALLGNGVGKTEIFDLSDPENPIRLDDFQNGYGCHDITFHITKEKQRAYCAGIEMTQIWDISDPAAPVVLADIPVHHGVAGTPSASVPLVFFSHLAMVNSDASVLIVGDETGGGLANACDKYVDGQAQTVAGPTGNLWFYDISDEKSPMLLSMINPDNPALSTEYDAESLAGCTAHFGRLIEDRDVLAMAFYGAGVVLIDFSDPSHPVIIDQFMPGTNTWDVWFWQGYLFTGDLNRGMDVLALT